MVGHFSIAGGVNVDQNSDLQHLARQDVSSNEEVEHQGHIDTKSEKKVSASKTADAKKTTREVVYKHFENTPILYHVAKCESRWRQYNSNGDPLRGIVNSRDVGVMQINEYYHLKQAEKLGYNIYTLEGNIAYAKYLYKRQGLQPWSASKPCWGREEHLATKQ